jgi:hypothetical protein
MFESFRVLAPQAAQGAAFQEDGGSDARSIVKAEFPDFEDES